MKKLTLITMLASACLLMACGERIAIRGELDPDYAPKISDPIAVVLPDNSSIQDRQLAPLVKEELSKAGFTVVEPDKAVWILGLGTHDNTIFLGTQSSAFGFYHVAFGSSTAEYATRGTLQFWLFKGDVYRGGKSQPIWAGTETIKEADDLRDSPERYIKPLIVIYGKNFHDDSVKPERVTPDNL